MGDKGNPNSKAAFIGLGNIGLRARNLVQPVFDALIRQAEALRLSIGTDSLKDQPLSMLSVLTGNSLLGTPCRSLREADLLYVSGSQTGDDFPNVRHAILEAMKENAFLFILPLGPGPVVQPFTEQKCVLHVQGPNPMEDIAHFVRDFTVWNVFPHTISCDWADIKTCLGGKEKRLAVYQAQPQEYESGLSEFLTQHRFELARSSSVLLHCGWKCPDVPWDALLWPMEMLGKYVSEGVPMVYLESTETGLEPPFRAFLLL